MVLEEGLVLSKVARKLKLKVTTARLIIQQYKATGEYHMRVFRKKTRQVKKVPKLVRGLVQVEANRR
jgi:hypothetical protein